MTAIGDLTEIRRLIRHGWEEVAAEYAQDRVGIFGQSARRLLELLHPSSGSRLLDVGTGAVALQAPRYVGSVGQVIGTDVATAMISLADQAAAEQGMTGLTFCQMDAERLDFADLSFDTVTCAFSLFQFPDMPQALAEQRETVEQRFRALLEDLRTERGIGCKFHLLYTLAEKGGVERI